MRTRVLALLAFTLFTAALIANAALRPAPGQPGSWLTQEASPTLLKTCAVLVVAYYVGWALFIAYKRRTEGVAGTVAQRNAEWRTAVQAAGFKVNDRSARVTHLRPAPTQPIPIPPQDPPTVVNE